MSPRAASLDALGLRVREALVEAMRILHDRGLVNLRGGNASARVDLPYGVTYIYITPSARPKHRLNPLDIAVMGLDGSVVEGRPSSEYRLHLAVYRARGDVRAVVHAHNPLTVAVARLGLHEKLVEASVEAKFYIGGCVALVGFHEPGTQELAEAAARALQKCNAAILENHGAVAVGLSRDPVEAVYEAVDRLEALEDTARIVLAEKGCRF